MSNEEDWSAVTLFLYSGILSKISLWKAFPRLVTPENLKELEDVIKIFSKNCFTSKSLREEYQTLCESLLKQSMENGNKRELPKKTSLQELLRIIKNRNVLIVSSLCKLRSGLERELMFQSMLFRRMT